MSQGQYIIGGEILDNAFTDRMIRYKLHAQFPGNQEPHLVMFNLVVSALIYCIHLRYDRSLHPDNNVICICYFVASCLFCFGIVSPYGVVLCCCC